MVEDGRSFMHMHAYICLYVCLYICLYMKLTNGTCEPARLRLPQAMTRQQATTPYEFACCSEYADRFSLVQVNGETVKLGIPGAAQRMEASAKLMIPLQRVGTPEDAAGAMLMLASPYSSYISAQVLLQAFGFALYQ